MNREISTSAVILDTAQVYDADRIFVLFSEKMGKVRARAKGVLKPTSKMGGHLIQFLPVKLILLKSEKYLLITQASLIDATIPENSFAFLKSASQIAEVVDQLFVHEDPHPIVYHLLAVFFDSLRVLPEEKHPILVAEFILKCLAELGYRPQLTKCVVTGEALNPERIGWSAQAGGSLSEAIYAEAPADRRILSDKKVLIVIRELMKPELLGDRLKMDLKVEQEVCNLILELAQTIIGRPLKSVQSFN